MNRTTIYIIVIVLIGASIGGALAVNRYYFTEDEEVEEPENVVEEGDIVTVHYKGWLEDDRIYEEERIFDSSREVTDPTIITFTERDRGEPFQFTVGEGVIEGWNENIIGMQEGETKTFTVPPEKAYPEWSEDLIVDIERDEKIPVYEEIDMDTFSRRYGEEPNINMVVTDRFWSWDKTVISIEGEIVTMMHQPDEGETYQTYIEGSWDWTTEVLSIDSSDDVIELWHEVDKPSLVDAEHIALHREDFADIQDIKMESGQGSDTTGIVVGVSEEKITLDFNEEVNNTPLTFEMEILEIQKGIEE